jgi:hypothetical protein
LSGSAIKRETEADAGVGCGPGDRPTLVIARETIKAMGKNVLAKLKLLEKQKEGKKRMKRVGRAEVGGGDGE